MKKIIIQIIALITLIATVFAESIAGGIILWFIYSHIHVLFPTAAAKGIIAQSLGWWDSVCIVWIFGLLIKSPSSSSSTK